MPRTARAQPRIGTEGLSHLEDLWDEPAPSNCSPLKGSWLTIAGRRQGRLLVSGTRMALQFSDGTIYMGTFSLGRHGNQATMDIHVDEGPANHKGQRALCIYELQGETLYWCASLPGRPERPADFTELDPHQLHLVFRREPANRKG